MHANLEDPMPDVLFESFCSHFQTLYCSRQYDRRLRSLHSRMYVEGYDGIQAVMTRMRLTNLRRMLVVSRLRAFSGISINDLSTLSHVWPDSVPRPPSNW